MTTYYFFDMLIRCATLFLKKKYIIFKMKLYANNGSKQTDIARL